MAWPFESSRRGAKQGLNRRLRWWEFLLVFFGTLAILATVDGPLGYLLLALAVGVFLLAHFLVVRRKTNEAPS